MLTGYCIDCDKCRDIRKCPSDLFKVPDGPTEPNGWPMSEAMKTWLRTDSECTVEASECECEYGCHSDHEDSGNASEGQAGASTPALSHSGSSLCTLDLSLALDATLRADLPSHDDNKNTATGSLDCGELPDYHSSSPDFQDDYAGHFSQFSDDATTWQAAQQQQQQQPPLGQTVMPAAEEPIITPNREPQPVQRRKAFLNFTNVVSKGVRKRLATSIGTRWSQKQPESGIAALPQTFGGQEAAKPDPFVKKRRLNDMGENTHTDDELHDIRGLSTYEHGVVSGTMTPQELEALHRYYNDNEVSSPPPLPETQRAMSYLEEVARSGGPGREAGINALAPHLWGPQSDEQVFEYDPLNIRDDLIQMLKASYDEIVDRKDRLIDAQQTTLDELCDSATRQATMIAELQETIASMQEESRLKSVKLTAPRALYEPLPDAPLHRAFTSSPIHEKSSVQQDTTAGFSPVKRPQAPVLQPAVFEGMRVYQRSQKLRKTQLEGHFHKYTFPSS